MEQALNNLEPQDNQQLKPVVQLLATGLEHESFDAAATAVVARLAEIMNCSSASYGSYEDNQCSLIASSQSADIDVRTNISRATAAAMVEAISQDSTIFYPQLKSQAIVRAHTELQKQANTRYLCTLPINHNGELVGAFLLEWNSDTKVDAATISLCELIAALIGPVLQGKLLEERSLRRRIHDEISARRRELFEPKYASLKFASVLVVVATFLLTVVTGEYRVTADAALEGLVERVVITPIDGYILEAHVRAGDEVSKGELMALMDDRDLQLERSRWFSEQQQIERSYRAALGDQDRTEVVILKAKLDQVTAKLELADERLARTRITAPLNGVVVSGDLSKSLGAPVERGEVLFQVMPMADYRVMLKVDERAIGKVVEKQRGTLALNGFPSERFGFEVSRVTPVSLAEEGNNYFLVEASLDGANVLLRPGMQGVAKIDAGEQRLGWILTHEIVDWLRLWVWA